MVFIRALVPLAAFLGLAAALPYGDQQTVFASYKPTNDVLLSQTIYLNEDRIVFKVVKHQSLVDYQLRITVPTLCDDPVQQYSGYLDISDTKHLFFWFFEARESPETAPLILWLNGGPGASTIASGLLFEHGPCMFSTETNTTVRNAFGWNQRANIIYLDQPVGTGFSYADKGSDDITTLEPLAADVFALLQIFLRRFPKYADAPFHVMGESWGGHYVPRIGSHIFDMNERLEYAPFPGQLRINLESLVVANGLTEPRSQFETTTDYLCGGAPYPPYKHDDWRCRSMRLAVPACLRMIDACYRFDNNATCTSATAYCWPVVQGTLLTLSGKNVYDLRVPCEGELCYPELDGIAQYLNSTSTKRALGARVDIPFAVANMTLNSGFYKSGQAMRNSASLLPKLINNGIRVMAYAGDTDGMCNYKGIELWMSRLEHVFHDEFVNTASEPWELARTRFHVGNVRVAGSGAGNVTFVRVFEGGHMVPHDQPEATQDMLLRWIENKPFF